MALSTSLSRVCGISVGYRSFNRRLWRTYFNFYLVVNCLLVTHTPWFIVLSVSAVGSHGKTLALYSDLSSEMIYMQNKNAKCILWLLRGRT